MSGAPRLPAPSDDLILDPGVLMPGPVLEVQGWAAVARQGGLALLPWREHARAAGEVPQQPVASALAGFNQAVVRVGKGRAATWADVATAWNAVLPAGRLLLSGSNDVGITTWVKRVQDVVGSNPEVLAKRARGRVVSFSRTPVVLQVPAAQPVPLPDGTPLVVAPGVFSGDGLDAGTAALLAALAIYSGPSATIADVGCGAGHLAAAAARQFPQAQVWMLDADARAVANARVNVPSAKGVWWDDQDPWPAPVVDLALVNPPWHAGTASDPGVGQRLLAAIRARWLLVVANRHLPYERLLSQLGTMRSVSDCDGFKVLEVCREL
jgi:16S rRNA (guanine1207-N2)-methyltransferase